jgi:hypothetical protein
VSRFRSSPEFAARSEANFGIEGERLLPSERGRKRQGGVGKGLKAQPAQPMPLISPNTPNMQTHAARTLAGIDFPFEIIHLCRPGSSGAHIPRHLRPSQKQARDFFA